MWRAAAKGHPWPSAAKPASCRFTLQINIEFRPAWFDGALKIKIKVKVKNKAKAKAALNLSGPYLNCRSEFIREAFVAAPQIYGISAGPFPDKSGPTRECVHIRCCGNGGLGLRPDGASLSKSAKVTKALLPHHLVPRFGSACP
jgi:hypothetical protein